MVSGNFLPSLSQGPLYQLVNSEQLLEQYDTGNISTNDLGTVSASLNELLKIHEEPFKIEVLVVQSKMFYIRNFFDRALYIIKSAHLGTVRVEHGSSRLARTVAEGYALSGKSSFPIKNLPPKGLCTEEHARLSEQKLTEVELSEICDYYTMAAEMTFHHVQEVYTQSNEPNNINPVFSKIVLHGMQRLITLVALHGNKSAVVEKFHHFLRFLEFPSLRPVRQWLACQFADFLLREMCPLNYEKFDFQKELSYSNKVIEKSLKFSYKEFHISHQFALSLVAARCYYRAYLVLIECIRLDPNLLSLYLMASSLCLSELDLIQDGIKFAAKGIKLAEEQGDDLLCARFHLILGWGYSLCSRNYRLSEDRDSLVKKALKEYTKASQLDPNDYTSWYHIGVQLACQRQSDAALKACQRSLQLAPSHVPTLCLLILLHSSGLTHSASRLDHARRVVDVGLAFHPNDFALLSLLARLETLTARSPVAGIRVYKRLLTAWRDKFGCTDDALSPCHNASSTSSQTLPINSLELVDQGPSADESASYHINNLEMDHLTKAMACLARGQVGRIGADLSPALKAATSDSATYRRLQSRVYQELAALYMEDGQLKEANEALDEAAKVGDLDPEIFFLRGRLAEKQGFLVKARSYYESVVAIRPDHLKSLLALADILNHSGHTCLAERFIETAKQVDPYCCRVWRLYAVVLSSPESVEPVADSQIVDAQFKAVELEETEPIEPYYSLPLGIRCY